MTTEHEGRAEGILPGDVDHWIDLRVHYSDDDPMPPAHDLATFVEVTLHNAMRDGHGPFPGNLVERDRIADTVTVGVRGESATP